MPRLVVRVLVRWKWERQRSRTRADFVCGQRSTA